MNQELLAELEVLKDGRKALLEPYFDTNSDIYHCLYKYYNSPSSLSLHQSFFNVQYLDEQYRLIQASNISEEEKSRLSKKVIQIINGMESSDVAPSTEFFRSIFEAKKQVLQSMMDVSKEEQQKYRQIVFEYDRDKFLFEKMFAEELAKSES